ncbi:MAG: hypothetical protein JST94_00860 [Bacteroidetes bacterium]|nr:hypothetical protein [Bacteroidota bacterium]MBS1670004.1 hypothetical protein [Bacteroidota bacterium]
MYQIEIGDTVRHKTNQLYNRLPMTVIEIDEDKIYCNYFDNHEQTDKKSPPFSANELELIKKVDGRFVSEGEPM